MPLLARSTPPSAPQPDLLRRLLAVGVACLGLGCEPIADAQVDASDTAVASKINDAAASYDTAAPPAGADAQAAFDAADAATDLGADTDDVRTTLGNADTAAEPGDTAAEPSDTAVPSLDAGSLSDQVAEDESAGTDAGPADSAAVDALAADASPTIICPSGIMTPPNGPASLGMHPGQACLACHDSYAGAPNFMAAGTVYPALNVSDLCAGVPNVQVYFTFADGMPSVAWTNNFGNFMQKGTVKLPYTVKLVVDGKERAMKTPQYDGDCNHCHTAKGAYGAPGRILAP